MQTVNDYDKNVFNGDLGRIVSMNSAKKKFIVEYESERIVEYAFDEADQLSLAYAVTIHKSQGSEFPAVVLPLLTQHYAMLQKNLLYTGMTRAKKLLILIGSRKAVELAVSNIRLRHRYSLLDKRLKLELQSQTDQC
jgi:exodeoxyribonuclease V alpha subunit